MTDYNFWSDLLDTFQSSADWIKVLWIIVLPALPLGALAMLLRYRLESRRLEAQAGGELGELAYSVIADGMGNFRVYAHDRYEPVTYSGSEVAMLPLPVARQPAYARHASSDL